MSKDEVVNGPKIAAAILSRMSSSHQAKLMDAIKAKDKKIAQEITKNIITYEDISELTDQGVQILVKSVEHKDLVVSLKTASEKVKIALYRNMSQRKKQVVEEDFSALPPTKLSEIEESHKRIVAKMDELITLGLIHTH
jgi:flagellar motor switch protein FliG